MRKEKKFNENWGKFEHVCNKRKYTDAKCVHGNVLYIIIHLGTTKQKRSEITLLCLMTKERLTPPGAGEYMKHSELLSKE
jgi:hypothetical protein